MAAASAVKDEHSETGHGENQNNLPLKVEGNQDCFKTTLAVEKQGIPVEGGKAQEKNEKAEPAKKFVDAPLPATNAWTKRSSSLTSTAETTQAPQVPELKKEAALNDKAAAPQGNAVLPKASKGNKTPVPNVESVKNEKPKVQKSKTELNGNKQADNNLKPKIKKFGEDFVEAPLPAVNAWKIPSVTTVASGLVSPVAVEQDPTPAAAAAAAVVSPSSYGKDLWAIEKPFPADSKKDPKKDPKPLESATNETEPRTSTSPVLVDENWPTLHEVKVTEPNQTMPPKTAKSPRVKVAPAAPATTTGATPVVSAVASAPVDNVEVSPSPSGQAVDNSADSQETAQTQTQNDSGGDDSSKENKESTANDDDTSNAVRIKKGTKPKWQRMEIDHPKPDRRNRRSRSQGRGYSPPRRGARPAGARATRPNSRRSEGPDSQNWRANMIPQGTTTPTDSITITTTTTTIATDLTTATDFAQTAIINEHLRGGPGMNFTGNRNPRGRGGLRGNGLRRGAGRGRGGIRDTKSPPFQVSPNSWNHEQVFHTITADPDTIPVPWSQGFNRVHGIPRVPPINQVVLGMEANLFLQEQLLNILGQASVYYDVASNTYPGPLDTLKHQVEYYFSEDNLVKDLYLRKKMDKQGWVELGLVLSFNKVKELKADYKSLIQAIRGSDKLELSENEDYVRTLNYPESWPIDPDFSGLPPPIEVQRMAAMSTLHSDAPEFVPGKPFVLRNLASSVPESSIPVTKEDDVVPNSECQEAGTEEQDDSLVSDVASNLATIPPPMLSSR